MSLQKQKGNGGIGFFTVLFLIFLTLKLLGAITWSWWWVFAPLIAPLAIAALAFGFILLVSR
jgi:hypothetical protein